MIHGVPRHEIEEGFTWLGRYGKYDLWHGRDVCGVTVVARWGNGGDYSSGMCFGWIDVEDHPLVEARKRAEAMGLDVEREKWAGKMRLHPCGIYYTDDEQDLDKVYQEE